MIKTNYITKACLSLLSLSLLFVWSCKKSEPEAPAPEKQAQAPEAAPKEAPKVEAPQETPAADTNAAPAGMVALSVELPKPMFVGTPQNIQVPNLEKPRDTARPTFYVPEGTTNVASKKSVTGSDNEPIIGSLAMVTDGDKEGADGSYVELGPGLQYVTIDLGEQYDIYAILVWHFHKQARVYFDTVVQLADDPDFLTNVRTVFNNDNDNSAGLGIGSDLNYIETFEAKLIDAKGQNARYVRLYSKGNNANELNHYIEVEVWGKSKK